MHVGSFAAFLRYLDKPEVSGNTLGHSRIKL